MKKRSTNVTKNNKDNRAALLKRDVMGRTAIHNAVLCNEPEALQRLLAYPELKDVLLLVDYENGWNILHYIYFYKRVRCLNVLMEYLDSRPSTQNVFIEMLKTKDRCRHAPLTLLCNDAKDFAWVPSYINEKNEFHLKPRFEQRKSEDPDDVAPSARSPFREIPHDWWSERRGASDIYVFGVNVNNNLGVGDSTDRSLPSHLPRFEFNDDKKEDSSLADYLRAPRYKRFYLSKYHSVAVTLQGTIYTCGVGSRGRLGHGNSSNVFRLKKIDFFDDIGAVAEVAISNNHNLVLTENGELYTWGYNNLYQLGFTSTVSHSFRKSTTDVYENTPKHLFSGDLRKNLSLFLGIGALKIHSLAYTSHSVYFWGLNIGQMGLEISGKTVDHSINGLSYKGDVLTQPKEVTFRDKIKLVATCETCTCIVTETNDIHVYFGGQRVKLPKLPTRIDTDSQFDSFKPSKLSSPAVIKKIAMKSHEHVHVLLENGNVMSFLLGSSDLKALRSTKFSFLWLAHDIDMYAVDIDNSYDGSVMVCTRNGSVFAKCYQANMLQRKNVNSSTLPTFKSSTKNKFRKVEGVNRVLRVSCDDSFSSFAVMRDEIDMLPFKLQKNDFILDMAFLSPLSGPGAYRKQNQLLETDHDEECYISNFLYPKQSTDSEGKSSFLQSVFKHDSSNEEEPVASAKDNLLHYLLLRHSSSCKPVEVASMYQAFSEEDVQNYIKIVCSEDFTTLFAEDSDWNQRKFCDSSVVVASHPNLKIGFHSQILQARSPLFDQLVKSDEEGLFFVDNDLRGHYDSKKHELHFDSQIDIRAVLIWLHYTYTNRPLEVWVSDFAKTGNFPMQQIKQDFHALINLFKMDIFHCKDQQYLDQLKLIISDPCMSDTEIDYAGGTTRSLSALLMARTAFFETMLSGRWHADDLQDQHESKKILLEIVEKTHMDVILKHIHGCNDLEIFEDAKVVVQESRDQEDFILFLLEMIEISDELLLVQLKYLCELAITEFISLNNVLVILAHADHYNAPKLLMSCCWYIYNNLEILLFDSTWQELDVDLLNKVETQIQFFDGCKHADFAVVDADGYLVEVQTKDYNRGSFALFSDDLTVFNEIYMSDRKGFMSFDILVDLKQEMLPPKEGRKKLSARRLSRKGSFESMVKNLTISQVLKQEVDFENAIADDDEFEVVGGRRKRDRSYDKTNELLPEKSPVPSIRSAKEETVTWNASYTTEASSSNTLAPLTPVEFYANGEGSSRNASNVSVHTMSPALGETVEQVKKPTKIKFSSSMKISQKQRKKLAKEKVSENGQESNKISTPKEPSKTPWNLTPPASSSRISAPTNLNNLPVLGQVPLPQVLLPPKEDASWVGRARTGPVKKTLQEVQEEEEFARWWEEESRRVQMQLSGRPSWSGNEINNGSLNANSHTNGSRARNGVSRGKRGSRSSNAP